VRRLSILGSTGSVGNQTLALVAAFPERFRAVALAAGRNVERLAEQVRVHHPEVVAVADREAAEALRGLLGGEAPEVAHGPEGLAAVAGAPADLVVSALVGARGLAPTLAAVRAGRDVALANKEALVCAGALFRREVDRAGVRLLPVDSEHSAIFQVLAGQRREDLARILLTASGGPFRTWPAERIATAGVDEALAHPNWDMGPKITVDSATLMNKGLEVIEARFLFDVDPERIGVVVHPQSIVHSMVEFADGSVLAQLGVPDMRVPIAVALAWPERLPLDLPRLDLAEVGRLDFEEPDRERFPCLDLAFAALGGPESAPAVLNAANEVAVEAFLTGRIPLPEIARTNARVLEEHLAEGGFHLGDVEAVLAADRRGRRRAAELLGLPAAAEVA